MAHSTPLGLLYLGTHALFCRAAGSVVAPGFAVPPRPLRGLFRESVREKAGKDNKILWKLETRRTNEMDKKAGGEADPEAMGLHITNSCLFALDPSPGCTS